MRRTGLTLGAMLIAAPALAGEIWVTNEKGNTVSVIDTATLEVTRTLHVGQRPRGIIFSRDHSQLYVCASDDDAVQVLDPETGAVLYNLPSGADPEQFALHPDGRFLYIANEDDAIATVVDTVERRVVAEIDVGIEPEGMAVSPDGRVAITTSETTNMAHWIDVQSQQIFHNSLVDQRPRHAEFTANGDRLWVSSEIGGSVMVFSTADQAVLARITFALPGVTPERIQPVGIRITRDGKRAFVALGPSNHVAVVSGETYEVEKYLLVGRRVWHLEMTPDEKLLFTTNGLSNDVTVIDMERLRPIKSIQVGEQPWGVAYRP